MEDKVKVEPGLDECSSGLELEKKTPFWTPQTASEKQIVVNAYNYIEKSSPHARNKTILRMKVAEMLGIEPASVYRVMKEHAQEKTPVETMNRPSDMSETDKCAIRKMVYRFFENDEIPLEDLVLKAINDDEKLPTFKKKTFGKIMKHLQFKFLSKAKNAVLDKDSLVIRRRSYLDKIMGYRKENREIFYVDEAWINVEETAPESSTAKTTTNDIKTLNIVHIGNENGFLQTAAEIFESGSKKSNDLMTTRQFERWFKKTVKQLDKNTIIVLDDAPYHCRQVNELPNNNWPKTNVQDWLRNWNIEFTDEEVKALLLEKVDKLVDKMKLPRITYAVDEIAKKYKVEVLRLPPFHYELNPMSSVLAEVKEHVTKNSSTLDEAKKNLSEGIEKYPVEKWASRVEDAKQEECYFYKIDDTIDDVMDRLNDTVKSGSESSDDTESSSDDLSDDTESNSDDHSDDTELNYDDLFDDTESNSDYLSDDYKGLFL